MAFLAWMQFSGERLVKSNRLRPRVATQDAGIRAITPRRTRLLRARDLQSFQRAIVDAVTAPGHARPDERVVLVPSRAAAVQLHQTMEELNNGATQFPALLTRFEWYAWLHRRLPALPPALSDVEREVMLSEAARDTAAAGVAPPFVVRPGLIAEMLVFYDALRRQQRTLVDFERLTVGELQVSAPFDHGAARVLDQTRFLVEAFVRFEARVEAANRLDEHRLRARLLVDVCRPPFRHVVVTVADQIVSTDGLWVADFDLLTRLPYLEQVDIVTTEGLLACGFLERLHEFLPGIEEERVDASLSRRPSLEVPVDQKTPYFVNRDREEELWAVARRMKTGRGAGASRDALADGAVGVVFQRPLPYVYLAEQVFGGSKISFETLHGLPLAAEPYAAFVDFVLDAVISGFARSDLVALLRSPHLSFDDSDDSEDENGDGALPVRAVSVFNRVLEQVGYIGGRDSLMQIADSYTWRNRSDAGDFLRSLNAALAIIGALAAIETVSTVSEQWQILLAFLKRYKASGDGQAVVSHRQARVREAVCGAIVQLERAAAVFPSPRVPSINLKASFRRRIGTEVFIRDSRQGGVRLVDTAAARYGRFRELHVVGLVDGEWPCLPPRNIFYPKTLLRQLGWPVDVDWMRIARAEFADLLRLPTGLVRLSTFQLEHDAVTAPTTLLEDVPEIGLASSQEPRRRVQRASVAEMLSDGPIVLSAVTGEVARWLVTRHSAFAVPRAPGIVGTLDPRPYAVSRVERYLDCPFKYFCASVLRLGEEDKIEPTLTRRAQGVLLHQVLRKFFEAWQGLGHRGFAQEDIDTALGLARQVVDEKLAVLPPLDRQRMRNRLLGSAASSGLIEQLVRIEVERSGEVVESLVERSLDGEFEFRDRTNTARHVSLRGVADRVDLLADGSLRLIDYKLGRAPRGRRAIQLPIYATCAAKALAGHQGRSWVPGEAAYIAFGASRPSVPIFGPDNDPTPVLAESQARFLDAIDGIERGEMPPRPAEDRLCASCDFAAVCRKGALA